MKFRIPRKDKKKIKGFFLYPINNNSYEQGFPKRNQTDYSAYKNNILTDKFKQTKKERKEYSKNFEETYYKEIEVSDTKLLEMVNDTFATQYRKESYRKLLIAKESSKNDYYTFINAYKLKRFNICCMTIDIIK
jgi:hypothetical protein